MNKIKSFLLLLLIVALPVHAELMHSSTWGYTLDLPEGFELKTKTDTESYQFEHSFMPVTLVIKAYPSDKYSDSIELIHNTMSVLNATTLDDVDHFFWQNANCGITQFTMKLNTIDYEGWALACPLPENKGITLLLGYSPKEKASDCQQFLLSILDSFSINNAALKNSGPITSYAFPETEDLTYTLNIAGKEFEVQMDKEASIANKFVIEREYAVLTLYASSSQWKEAWQRYYRMIYRDSYKRLQKVAFTIYNELAPIAQKKDSENKEKELAQLLLTWTQGFKYEREKTNSDFANLPSIIQGGGSDCDSRSMLLAVLLAQMHCKTILFVSAEYSHAIFGIAVAGIPGENAHMDVDGISYLLGETTAKVNLGMIAENMAHEENWIPIEGIQ